MTSTTGLVQDAERELRRCLDRIAALGPGRLARSGPRAVGAEAVDDVEPLAPVDLVRPLLQQLADDAADLEGEPHRDVPVLGPHALGDQLAVLARDVLAAARSRHVLAAAQARDDAGGVERLHERLVALRRLL